MQFTFFTLFPDYFTSPLDTSLVGKARERGLLRCDVVDLRDYAADRHRTVDEPPYGGGPGMVLKPAPVVRAFEAHPPHAHPARRVFLTPWGRPLTQRLAAEWSQLAELHLLCGRYEGVDERVVEGWIDDCVSVGDAVLAGGEAPALCVLEAVARLLPGVVGDPNSLREESFQAGLLEGPHYTRPAVFRGREVPAVLRSGDHAAVAAWRRAQARERTRRYRPELLREAASDADA